MQPEEARLVFFQVATETLTTLSPTGIKFLHPCYAIQFDHASMQCHSIHAPIQCHSSLAACRPKDWIPDVCLSVQMPPRSRSRVPVGTYGDSCDGCRSSPPTIGGAWWFNYSSASRTKTFGPRAFAIAGPQGWNNVSMDLHDSSMSYREFCSKLKTYLYRQVIWKHSN